MCFTVKFERISKAEKSFNIACGNNIGRNRPIGLVGNRGGRITVFIYKSVALFVYDFVVFGIVKGDVRLKIIVACVGCGVALIINRECISRAGDLTKIKDVSMRASVIGSVVGCRRTEKEQFYSLLLGDSKGEIVNLELFNLPVLGVGVGAAFISHALYYENVILLCVLSKRNRLACSIETCVLSNVTCYFCNIEKILQSFVESESAGELYGLLRCVIYERTIDLKIVSYIYRSLCNGPSRGILCGIDANLGGIAVIGYEECIVVDVGEGKNNLCKVASCIGECISFLSEVDNRAVLCGNCKVKVYSLNLSVINEGVIGSKSANGKVNALLCDRPSLGELSFVFNLVLYTAERYVIYVVIGVGKSELNSCGISSRISILVSALLKAYEILINLGYGNAEVYSILVAAIDESVLAAKSVKRDVNTLLFNSPFTSEGVALLGNLSAVDSKNSVLLINDVDLNRCSILACIRSGFSVNNSDSYVSIAGGVEHYSLNLSVINEAIKQELNVVKGDVSDINVVLRHDSYGCGLGSIASKNKLLAVNACLYGNYAVILTVVSNFRNRDRGRSSFCHKISVFIPRISEVEIFNFYSINICLDACGDVVAYAGFVCNNNAFGINYTRCSESHNLRVSLRHFGKELAYACNASVLVKLYVYPTDNSVTVNFGKVCEGLKIRARGKEAGSVRSSYAGLIELYAVNIGKGN